VLCRYQVAGVFGRGHGQRIPARRAESRRAGGANFQLPVARHERPFHRRQGDSASVSSALSPVPNPRSLIPSLWSPVLHPSVHLSEPRV
jgi:hypothetical protein